MKHTMTDAARGRWLADILDAPDAAAADEILKSALEFQAEHSYQAGRDSKGLSDGNVTITRGKPMPYPDETE